MTVLLSMGNYKIDFESLKQKMSIQTTKGALPERIEIEPRKAWGRAQSVGRTEEEKNSHSLSEQPFTLAYTISKCEQQILFSLKTNGINLKENVKDDISKAFKKLEDSLKELHITFEATKAGIPKSSRAPAIEMKKTIEGINDDFSQARQAIRLCNKMISIELNKLEFDLNALKSSIKVTEKRPNDSYISLMNYSASQGRRSQSQSNRGESSNESSLLQKVSGIQKEFGKLKEEIKKIESKSKIYEDLFDKKDSVAQSLLSSYKTQPNTPPESDMNLQISRKNEEISRLKEELASCTQQIRKSQIKFAVQPSTTRYEDPTMLEKLSSEALLFLGIMDKLKRAIMKKDEAYTEKYRLELEEHKKVLTQLASSSRTPRSTSTRFNFENENIMEIQRQKREIEYQYEKQSEDLIRYQNNLLEYVEKLKVKDQEIERLQQEMLQYRARLQSLQDEFSSMQIPHAENNVSIEHEIAEGQIQIAEIVRESNQNLSSGFLNLKNECDSRIENLQESVLRIAEKISKYVELQKLSEIRQKIDNQDDQDLVENLKNASEILKNNNETLKNANEILKNDKIKLTGEIENLRAELKKAQKMHESEQESNKEFFIRLKESVIGMTQAKYAEFLEQISEKAEKFESVKSNFENVLNLLGTQINEQIDEIEKLKEENSQLRETAAQQSNEEIESLKTELQNYSEKYAEISQNLDSEKQNSSKLNAQITENKAKMRKFVNLLQKYGENMKNDKISYQNLLKNISEISENAKKSIFDTYSIHGLLDEMREKSQNYKIEINEKTEKIAEIIKEIQIYKDENKNLKLQINEISANLNTISRKNENNEETVKNLRNELNLAQKIKGNSETELKNQYEQSIRELKNEIANLQSVLNNSKEEYNKKSDEIIEKDILINEQKNAIESLEKTQKLENEEKLNLVKKFEEFKQKNTQLESDINLIKKQKNDEISNIKQKYEKDATESLSNIENLNNLIENLRKENIDKEKEILENKSEIEKLNKNIEKLQFTNQDLQDQNEKIKIGSETDKKEISRLENEILLLQNQRNEKESKYQSHLEQENNKIREENKNIQENINNIQSENKQLQISKSKLESEIFAKNQEISTKNSALTRLKIFIKEISKISLDAISKLRDELQNTKDSFENVSSTQTDFIEKMQNEIVVKLQEKDYEISDIKENLEHERNAKKQALNQNEKIKNEISKIKNVYEIYKENIGQIKTEFNKYDLNYKKDLANIKQNIWDLVEKSVQKNAEKIELENSFLEAQNTLKIMKNENEKLLLEELKNHKKNYEEIFEKEKNTKIQILEILKNQLEEYKEKHNNKIQEISQNYNQKLLEKEKENNELLKKYQDSCENIKSLEKTLLEKDNELTSKIKIQQEEEIIEKRLKKDQENTEINELKQILNDNKQQIDELHTENEKFYQENIILHEFLEKSKETTNNLKENLAELGQSYNKLIMEFPELLEKLKSCQVKIRDLENYKKFTELNKNTEKDLNKINTELSILNEQQKVKISELEKVKENAENEKNILLEKMKENEKKMSELEGSNKTLSDRVEWEKMQHDTNIEVIKANYDVKISDLQKENTELKNKLSEIQQTLNQKENEISEIKAQIISKDALISILEQENSKSTQQAKNMKITVSHIKSALKLISQDNLEQKSILLKFHDDLMNKINQNISKSNTNEKIKELQDENIKLKEKIEWNQSEHEIELETLKNDHEEKIMELNMKLNIEQEKIQKLYSSIEKSKQILQQNSLNPEKFNNLINSKLFDYENKISNLQSKLSKISSKLSQNTENSHKNSDIIQNYKIMLKNEQENSQIFSNNLQQTSNKLKKLEEDTQNAKNILQNIIKNSGELISDENIVSISNKVGIILASNIENMKNQVSEKGVNMQKIKNSVILMNKKFTEKLAEFNEKIIKNQEQHAQKIAGIDSMYKDLIQKIVETQQSLINSLNEDLEKAKNEASVGEGCKEILIKVLQNNGIYKGSQDFPAICGEIQEAFENKTEELTAEKEKYSELETAMNQAITNLLEQIRNFPVDPQTLMLPMINKLDLMQGRISNIEVKAELLKNRMKAITLNTGEKQSARDADTATISELKQALQDAKNDINIMARKEEEKSQERTTMEQNYNECKETLDAYEKAVNSAGLDLIKVLEEYGVTLGEDQKSQLETIVKCVIDLIGVLGENNVKKSGEKNSNGVKTPKADNLELEDDDFMVGLVQDISPKGSAAKSGEKLEPASQHSPVNKSAPPVEMSAKSGEKGSSSVVVTAKDAPDGVQKEPESWIGERERLQNRIAELEKNMEVSEASDVRWHQEYEEVKERIKQVVSKWADPNAEHTIDEIERIIDRMAETVENMRKEADASGLISQQQLASKNSRISELEEEITRLKETAKESQKNTEEKQKAVFFLTMLICKKDGRINKSLFSKIRENVS